MSSGVVGAGGRGYAEARDGVNLWTYPKDILRQGSDAIILCDGEEMRHNTS
jgi:hypothetical protein